jgi:uncharacterized protein (DUF433 family)
MPFQIKKYEANRGTNMNKHPQPLIIEDPDILGGLPVFYGTRVPVKTLVDYLTTGETIDEFLDDFPSVTRDQVVRFLEHAGTLAIAESHANTD